MTAIISMFRCANCGSGHVEPYAEGKKLKLSVFGMLKGKKIDEFRCPDCGAVLDHAMDISEKAKVDSMVVISGATEITVDKYLDQYENIEINPVTHHLKSL